MKGVTATYFIKKYITPLKEVATRKLYHFVSGKGETIERTKNHEIMHWVIPSDLDLEILGLNGYSIVVTEIFTESRFEGKGSNLKLVTEIRFNDKEKITIDDVAIETIIAMIGDIEGYLTSKEEIIRCPEDYEITNWNNDTEELFCESPKIMSQV